MEVLYQILLATLGISLLSLIGIILTERIRKEHMHVLVSFAAGTLLGASFLHLMPEGFEEAHEFFFYFVVGGFLLFFLFEKMIYWYHCHDIECKDHPKKHPVTYLSLIGDGIHNFTDGIIIAAAFMTDYILGITATIAIAAHEIPQEIGDFAILVNGGFTRGKALLANLGSALMAVLGAVLTFYLLKEVPEYIPYLIGIASGGFVYIAASDLVPEIHKITDMKESLLHFVFMLLGVALIAWINLQLHVH